MRTPGPFLIYLTVFKSRLGIANIVIDLTSFQQQQSPLLLRNLHKVLEAREVIPVADEYNYIFEYLADKRIVTGSTKKSSRYAGKSLKREADGWVVTSGHQVSDSLPVYKTDLWMSHPNVRSTIGVPTPENVEEVLEFAHQFGFISSRTNAWTFAGQVVSSLRKSWVPIASEEDNPFLLRAEGIALLRQFLRQDGLIVRPLLRMICGSDQETITRDWVSQRFEHVVQSAYDDVKKLPIQPPVVREGRKFLTLIQETTAKMKVQSAKSPTSRGPGVLEHRVAPRLEWLTDVGILAKKGLPKNSFQYGKTKWARLLLESLEQNLEVSAEDAALDQWNSNPIWADARRHLATTSVEEAFGRAYRMLQRRIGPAPIVEVAFLGALLSQESVAFEEAKSRLLELVQATEGATLAGGRLRRGPENVHLTDAALDSLS